jgi:signal transduction histidine kinase
LLAAAFAGVGVGEALLTPGASVGYARASPVLGGLLLAGGLALALAGAGHLVQHRAPRVVALTGVAALAWFSPTWAGWQQAPATARSAAEVLGTLLVPTVLLLVVLEGGRPVASPIGAASGLLLAGTGVTAALLASVRDPYLDPTCWANCSTNVFLVRSSPGWAAGLQVARDLLVGAASLGLVVLACSGLGPTRRSPGGRAVLVAASGGLLGLAALARVLEVRRAGLEDPYDSVLQAAFAVSAVALVLLGTALTADVARAVRRRRLVDRVVRDLGESPPPGSVERALGSAVGDPGLTISYRLPDSAGYVRADGRAVDEVTRDAGRTLTQVARHGEVVAVVSCVSASAPQLRSLRPALLLGLENERLRAGLLAQLDALRSSRARIVVAADQARRALERDLHDGAQQLLLAVSFDLRLASASAVAHQDAPTAEQLSRAVDLCGQALEQLRGVAHGIFPPALGHGALDDSLTTLAELVPVVVRLRADAGAAVPPPVASAAYFAALLALEDATARGATVVDLGTDRCDDQLVLSLRDDGAPRVDGMITAADRVGALGGTLTLHPRGCEVVIPCG